MKRIFILIILLSVPLASSISTNMLPSYQPSETMIIEIQGSVLSPINPSDILFKRGHVAIAVNYDVKRIGDKYYIYAQMPLNKNNYTLFINDILTTVNGQNQLVDYNQSFSISGNTSDYSINPGFKIASDDFTLTLNSNLDEPITINSNFPEERAITLQPGTNTIPFSISSVASGIYLASIGKYTVPIQVTKSSNSPSEEVQVSIFPGTIRQTILESSEKKFNFSITNTGNITADNLYFLFDSDLFDIEPSVIEPLEPSASSNFNLTLKSITVSKTINASVGSLTGFSSGLIVVARENKVLSSLTINVSFTNNATQVNQSTSYQYYCSELNGKFCSVTEICSQVVQALDGSCCTGICQTPEKSSNTWIIYVSIILILAILVFIFIRYKKNSLPRMPRKSPISPPLRSPPLRK